MTVTLAPHPSMPKWWRTGAENLSDCDAGHSHCYDRLRCSISEGPQGDYWHPSWPDSTLAGTTKLLPLSEAGFESWCGSS